MRTLASRPVLAIALGVVWSAAMLSFAMLREMPVGSVRGVVLADETGRPIADAEVTLSPMTDKDEPQPPVATAKTDERGAFHLRNLPAGAYMLEARGKVHHSGAYPVTVREGKAESVEMWLSPDQPFLRVLVHQHIERGNGSGVGGRAGDDSVGCLAHIPFKMH